MKALVDIDGVGPAAVRCLAVIGIETVEQLAGVDPAAPPALPGFRGRPNWAAWVAGASAALSSTGDPAFAGEPAPPTSADAGGATSEAGKPSAADAPAGQGPAGTNTSESEGEGGAGNPTGPAAGLTLDGLVGSIAAVEAEFRARFPHFAAAIDVWQASGRAPPTRIRVAAKIEGFRRAGMAHTKAPVDHDPHRFTPEQIEALLAEPNLTVELV